jgi:hypothetical protein
MVMDILVERIPHRIRIPIGPTQQMLEPVRGCIAHDFRELPAILALGGTEQAPEMRQRPLVRLGASKIRTQPLVHLMQPLGPSLHRCQSSIHVEIGHHSSSGQGVYHNYNCSTKPVVSGRSHPYYLYINLTFL